MAEISTSGTDTCKRKLNNYHLLCTKGRAIGSIRQGGQIPPPPLNFGPEVNLKEYFFQYNAVISRVAASIRQGGQIPPPPKFWTRSKLKGILFSVQCSD